MTDVDRRSAEGASWPERVEAELEAVRTAGRWRRPRRLDALGPAGRLHLDADGADHQPASGSDPQGTAVVSFAGNDYLGLSAHPAVVAAAHEALDRWGAGAGASRLVTGSRPVHHDLEEALAEWKGTARAVLFPTGYHANLSVIATLAGPGTRILSDELNHASIVDACRLARGDLAVLPHADLDALADALAHAPAGDRPTLVVTDSVFSMDGDAVDLEAVARLCSRHGALLVVDEAHAVLGPDLDPADHPDLALVRVGTLSKALGGLGGFAACSGPLADLLVNRARPYIFTTAPPPPVAAAALAALAVVRSAEGDALRARLRHHVERLAPGHPSPILPVILGTEEAALAAADTLLHQGLLVPAIRPPTVPAGSSRLRVTLSAAHTDEQVDRLVGALAAVATPDLGTRSGSRSS